MLLALVALPMLLDASGRWWRLRRSRARAEPRGASPRRVLAIVPSRAEGTRVLALAQDLLRESRILSAQARQLEAVVVLDGEDARVHQALTSVGVRVLVKSPAGPSKGAVLDLATAKLSAEIDAADTIVVLDADMRLPEGYFRDLVVPEGAEAWQAPAGPAGVPPRGAPRVEALSLAMATRLEDLQRDVRGLPVRLRGKAMGFSPRAWRLGPAATRTMAEDSEATLRLLAAGIRVRALPGPFAFDEPARAGEAHVAPRARWLAGHLVLLAREAGTILGLFLRRPLAAFVLLADLYLRPRALVLALVVLLGAASVGEVLAGARPFSLPATAALATLVLERDSVRLARRRLGFPPEIPALTARDLASALVSWLRAVARAIANPGRWHRARPELPPS